MILDITGTTICGSDLVLSPFGEYRALLTEGNSTCTMPKSLLCKRAIFSVCPSEKGMVHH